IEFKTEVSTLEVDQDLKEFRFHEALIKTWHIVSVQNKIVDENKLWELGKTDIDAFRKFCEGLLANLFLVAKLIAPVMPETSKKILEHLTREKITKMEPLFPKID